MRRLVGLIAMVSMAMPAAHAETASSLEPGVWLDMAMEACDQGLNDDVSRVFNHIRRTFAPEPGVLSWMTSVERLGCPLASRVLAPVVRAIESSSADNPWVISPEAATPDRRLRQRLSLGVGQNSNANAGPSVTQFILPSLTDVVLELDESSRPKRRTYVEGRYELSQVRDQRNWGLQLTAKHYPSLTSFSEQGLGLWLEQSIGGLWRKQNSGLPVWLADSQIGLSAGWVQLGGDPFVQQTTVSWRRSPKWPSMASTSQGHGWELSQQWQHYPQRTDFDARVTSADWLWQPKADVVLRLGAYQDLAQGNRPGGNRLGWRIMASWETSLPNQLSWAPHLKLGIRGLLDWSASSQAYSPGLLDMRRQHMARQFDLIAWHPLSQNWSLRTLLSRRQESDQVPILNFKNTGINLELGYRF